MEPKENPPKKPFDWTYASGYALLVFTFLLVIAIVIEKWMRR